MFRRWIRALARTGLPGRPFPVPPKTGRHPRTLLRLEAVEDRTLASITAVEPPKFLTATHVGTTSKPAKPTPSDDKTTTPSDGSDQTASPAHDGATFSAADATPAQMTGGFTLSATADLPAPHVSSTLDSRTAVDSDRTDESTGTSAKAQGDAQSGQSGVSFATDAGSATTNGPGTPQTPTDRPAGPSARVNSDAVQAVVSPSQLVRRNEAAVATTARSVTGEVDPIGPKGNRAGGSASSFSSTPAAGPAVPADLSDGALLQRFVANKEEAAFTALVSRYAPVVLGVCQRVLGDFHAAQDASQATFIILARKAGMLDRTSPLGGWLYKVAYHLALRSRGVAARQRLGERAAADETPAAAHDVADVEQQEVNQILREELQGLPEKYRAPLALVYIDGRSHADAAQAIGLPRGSMAKRVGEGLDRLRERLVHRGISL